MPSNELDLASFVPIIQSMKTTITLLLSGITLVSCGEKESTESAAQLYERAKTLLKPNVEQASADFKQAFEHLKTAAAAGHAEAQTALAGIYYGGSEKLGHMKADMAESLKWFQAAADQGKKQAHIFIGNIYAKGAKGVAQDMKAAVHHWTEAAKAGYPEAKHKLGVWFIQRQQDVEKGLKYLEAAAHANYVEATLYLGELYYQGNQFIKPNLQKAEYWYHAAVKQGSLAAQMRLGQIYIEGKKEIAKGISYLEEAARKGSVSANLYLGKLYSAADGLVPQDWAKSQFWYEQAAGLGDAHALYVCALFLLKAKNSIEAEEERALSYLRLAAGQDHIKAIAKLIELLRQNKEATAPLLQEAEAWSQRLKELVGQK